MKKPYDKYVKKSELLMFISIVLLIVSGAVSDDTVAIFAFILCLGATFYFIAKEKKEGA